MPVTCMFGLHARDTFTIFHVLIDRNAPICIRQATERHNLITLKHRHWVQKQADVGWQDEA